MRRLTEEEIQKFASRRQVRKVAVETFLATMGEDAYVARQNLRLDAKIYGWMPPTVKAILGGIALAEKEEQQFSSRPACGDSCPQCGGNLKKGNKGRGWGHYGVLYECPNPVCEIIQIRRYYNKGGKTPLKTTIIKSAAVRREKEVKI